MDFKPDFSLTSVSLRIPVRPTPDPYAPISILHGKWVGQGFNQIWRPNFVIPGSDHFLELNETLETLQFEFIPGDIPNRGLLQVDINLHGLTYLQQIQDANVLGPNDAPAGIHVETGMWLTVPATTIPPDPLTLVRMASIPHGAGFVAQGIDLGVIHGAPTFPAVSITPFATMDPTTTIPFPESTLSTPTIFRTPASDIPNVTQAMVDNPNSVLEQALDGIHVISTTIFQVSTNPSDLPSPGGGEAGMAFLGPNAQAAQVQATFWIETIELPGGRLGLQLQYSQMVLLNFNNLSWPHVSVATLVKHPV
jgi:hypothetical protein